MLQAQEGCEDPHCRQESCSFGDFTAWAMRCLEGEEWLSLVSELFFHGLHHVLCLWGGSRGYRVPRGCSCSCWNVTHLDGVLA